MNEVNSMAKCEDCQKNEVFDTTWEKITRWLLYRLFPKRIIELSQEKHLQGFGEGYKVGFGHAVNNGKPSERNITAS